MASSQDTEITLGTGKLLVLFFGLVGVCALFFALGYSLGRKSEPTMSDEQRGGCAANRAGNEQGEQRARCDRSAYDVLQVGRAERRQP